MQEEQIRSHRYRLQNRLYEYLKKTGMRSNDISCRCPNPDCGGTAVLRTEAYGEPPHAFNTWHCPDCRSGGDILDYVLAENPALSEGQAIHHIQRTLGERITDLDSVSAEELMAMHFPAKRWRVRDLMGPGLYVLGGPSKVGKSWMVLYFADRISKGEPVWDMPSEPCAVLYLSLEDTLPRLQERLRAVTGGTVGPVRLATEAELIGNGFEAQIENLLRSDPEIGLVIIDTLQKIRRTSAEGYSYAEDYAVMSALKRIADHRRITILLVHHTRKMQAEDPMDLLSGTTGIAGAADGALILRRSRLEEEATLTVMGRDAPEQMLRLRFDGQTKCWQLLGRGQSTERNEREMLFRDLRELTEASGGSWEGSSSALLEALEYTGELSAKKLSLLLKENSERLQAEYGLRFSARRTRQSRLLTLTLA